MPNIQVIRLINSEKIALMREYVVYHILRIFRKFTEPEEFQKKRTWLEMPPAKTSGASRVSVLCLGQIGLPVAKALRSMCFQVSGWAQSQKVSDGINYYYGLQGLEDLLPQTDILICILPLTPAKEGILNSAVFNKMKSGSSIINVSRGGCLNETDLLDALRSGQLAHEVLDVFNIEPLPEDSPLWLHPGITVTPHLAAYA